MIDYEQASKYKNEDKLSISDIIAIMRINLEYKQFQKRLWNYEHGITPCHDEGEDSLGNQDPQDNEIKSKLLKLLDKQSSIQSLSKALGQSERVVRAYIEDIKDEGYIIEESNGLIKKCNLAVNTDNKIDKPWNGEKIIRFGLMGDTQFNSNYVQITHLNNFYDICQGEGMETVYHTGDIDEGEEMRVGHKYECYTQGADAHIKEIIKNYPKRKGITTEFITGNHDHSIIKRVGLDIGTYIAKERPDMKYLGQSNALIYLTPNCTMELSHPIDGTAYAISYKPQKAIDAMSGGEKPNILATGHYHKAEYIFYRNVHSIQTGCFQGQTSFMKGKQIAAHVGGWIIEIHVNDDGTIKRFKCEFIPYYKSIKNDYENWR